jgi:hypothetical protein
MNFVKKTVLVEKRTILSAKMVKQHNKNCSDTQACKFILKWFLILVKGEFRNCKKKMFGGLAHNKKIMRLF